MGRWSAGRLPYVKTKYRKRLTFGKWAPSAYLVVIASKRWPRPDLSGIFRLRSGNLRTAHLPAIWRLPMPRLWNTQKCTDCERISLESCSQTDSLSVLLPRFRAGSLVGAEFVCGEGMSARTTSPLGIARARQTTFARPECQHQLAAAFQAVSLSHTPLLSQTAGFRCSQLNRG